MPKTSPVTIAGVRLIDGSEHAIASVGIGSDSRVRALTPDPL
jgi:hypothetical protein